MKYLPALVATSLICTQAFAFKPEHVEKLRSTASCANCDLSGFNFPSNANLEKADLSGASLSGANLSGANLSKANLSGANLTSTFGLKRF